MDTLYLSWLGSPQISLNERRVEIKRRKVIALLAYLAVENEPKSREFLSGLLWPEYNQSKAYAYLRRTVWEIKNTLGEAWLEAGREWIGVPASTGIQMDVGQFHARLQAVKDHDHPFTEPCEACIDLLMEAIRLWRGDFLAGFSLGDCPQFEDWQFLQSEIIRREFREVLQILVNALEQKNRLDEAIHFAQRWLAVDNLDESVHRKLMVLLAKNGQPQAALRQFEICREVLKTELDLEPEVETAHLYNHIRESRAHSRPGEEDQGQIVITGRGNPSWLEQILSEPVQMTLQTNLPARTTPFIGRQYERAEIATLLSNPDCWLLTLVGMGGIGKTRLADQVGRDQMDAFPQGVYFVSLEGLKSISGLAPAIGEALGLSFHHQGGSLQEQLGSYLRTKELLLVLDNFDAFAGDAAILSQLHNEACAVKFIITSRRRLQIRGEWVYEIRGLEYPESRPQKFEELLRFHAVDLFYQAARRARQDFQIHEQDQNEIVAITQLLEGMPLGLEMAAAWVGTLSAAEIAAEIRHNLDFLKAEFRDLPARQRSMRAVMDYSWELLSQDERRLLGGLSVFRGGFTRVAAEKVVGSSISDLKGLMDKSILQRRGSDRFHFHELMRQYAWEYLCQSEAGYRSANERHAAYYCAALRQWGEALKGPEQVETLHQMRQEIDNLQAAWAWVTQEKQIQHIDRALEGLCYFYMRNLRNQEGIEACQLGLAALAQVETETGQVARANLLTWAGVFCLSMNDHQKAGEYLDRAMALLPVLEGEGQKTDPLRARLFMTKAILENYRGNRESAIEFYDRSFAIYRQLGDLSTFSYLMLRVIDTGGVTSEKIFQYLSESIELKRKAGDFFNTAYLLYVYCQCVAYHFGQPARAEALMQESCKIFEKQGDPLSKEMTLACVDVILNTTGQYDELLTVREKKLAYAQERGGRPIYGIYLAEIGETLYHLGDYAAAEARFREALPYLEEGTPYQYGIRLCGLGEALLALGRAEEAQRVFEQSIQRMQIGEKWGLGKALAGLGMAAWLAGEAETTWKTIRQALQCHLEGHSFYFTHFSLAAYAYLLSRRGEALAGIEIYTRLARQKFMRDSCWFNDLYRKPIYIAAKNLLEEDIAAAEARGNELDFWKTLEKLSHQAQI